MVTLETCKLFRNLDAAELSALRHIATEQKFAAGQPMFKEGDKGDGIYVVKDGLVEISVKVADNVERVFAQLGPGEASRRRIRFPPRSGPFPFHTARSSAGGSSTSGRCDRAASR